MYLIFIILQSYIPYFFFNKVSTGLTPFIDIYLVPYYCPLQDVDIILGINKYIIQKD